MKYFSLRQAALLSLALATIHSTAFASDQPRKKYDSKEVVRSSKTVDHTGTVDTKREIPSTRVIETNHLIVHDNETRNVGTVQHNRTIVEKEVVLTKRNVDHKYINKVINEVKHEYHTERRHVIEEREIPGRVRYLGGDPIRAYGKATRRAHHASRRSTRSRY
jgi:hypothetical protein